MIYSTSIVTRRSMILHGREPRAVHVDRQGARVARYWYRRLRRQKVTPRSARWAIADLLEAGLVHGLDEPAAHDQEADQAEDVSPRELVAPGAGREGHRVGHELDDTREARS